MVTLQVLARQEQQDRPRVIAGGRIMATKITSDVLESYLHCKFKGYLKLAGQQGKKCDFEAMLTELRAEVRLKAIDTIIARDPRDQVARNIPLTTAGLKRGLQYILHAVPLLISCSACELSGIAVLLSSVLLVDGSTIALLEGRSRGASINTGQPVEGITRGLRQFGQYCISLRNG
jgi:hypothetical protein